MLKWKFNVVKKNNEWNILNYCCEQIILKKGGFVIHFDTLLKESTENIFKWKKIKRLSHFEEIPNDDVHRSVQHDGDRHGGHDGLELQRGMP